jgi:hypothetical protein
MAARAKKLLVEFEDHSLEALNSIRDAQRRALNRCKSPAMQEMRKRAPNDVTGNYSAGLDVEIPRKWLQLWLMNSAPHSHLVEYGTTQRQTKGGENRGSMKSFGVLRKSALKMRRVVMGNLVSELRNEP